MAKRLGALILGVLLSSCARVAEAPAKPEISHLIVVSIDGLLPDYYTNPELLTNFPGLQRFRLEGSSASRVRGVLPTLTFPSHTSLITGVDPACHGIETNLIFDPWERNRGGWNWYTEDIRSETLWQAAARQGLKTGSVFWPVTVGAEIDYLIPAFWQIGGGLDGIRLLRALSTPGLLDKVEEQYGSYDPRSQTDYERMQIGLDVFLEHRPSLMLVKLSDLDGTQHDHGPVSKEAIDSLKEIDRALQSLLSRLEASQLLGSTAVAVVSDHGSMEVAKGARPDVIFRDQGWVSREAGKVVDWKATPVIAGGLCAVILRDAGDEATLSQIRQYFQDQREKPGSGIGRIYEKSEIESMGGFKEASLLIESASDFRMLAGLGGPAVGDSPDRGAHGYTPGIEGQWASFLLLGPGVPAGQDLGQIEMVDVAPRLAALLGFELDRSDCPSLAERSMVR